MTKRSLLVWIVLFLFGFATLPEFGISNETKQAGKTEVTQKRKPKKKSIRKHKRTKKRKGSWKQYSGGKKKYSKKYSKQKRYSKRKKYSMRRNYTQRKRTVRQYYSPSTNSGTVEYRNYKRSTEGENSQDINKIAPEKEFKKEPRKDE